MSKSDKMRWFILGIGVVVFALSASHDGVLRLRRYAAPLRMTLLSMGLMRVNKARFQYLERNAGGKP
jgi:hypothetical protein